MIQVLNNTSGATFSSPVGGGVQMQPESEETSTEIELTSNTGINMTALGDVDETGLNNNDVLVFDQLTGKFKPVDIDVINNNDGGTW
tara:strand:+ start:62 stop:322 length:261 start_codon:yes stop_codon:yes gene_type:complete